MSVKTESVSKLYFVYFTASSNVCLYFAFFIFHFDTDKFASFSDDKKELKGKVLQRFPSKDRKDVSFPEGIEMVTCRKKYFNLYIRENCVAMCNVLASVSMNEIFSHDDLEIKLVKVWQIYDSMTLFVEVFTTQ
jgi:hypothetical protein